MRRRRRARTVLAGAIVATLAGAILALVPTPSFSVQKAMRVDDDAPLLSAVAAAKDTVLAHRESVSEFRLIGLSWDGDSKGEVSVRTIHDGTWTAWTPLGPADGGPDPRSRADHPCAAVTQPLCVTRADECHRLPSTRSQRAPSH